MKHIKIFEDFFGNDYKKGDYVLISDKNFIRKVNIPYGKILSVVEHKENNFYGYTVLIYVYKIEVIIKNEIEETDHVLSKDIKGNISLDINKQVKDQFLKNILTAEGYSLLEKAKEISKRVKEELADILIYSITLAEGLDLDINSMILEKIKKNGAKYPKDGDNNFR